MNVIVLVEDHDQTRTALARWLAPNFTVLGAFSGRDGLVLLRSNPLACALILDLGLPDMSGFDVLRQKNADPLIAAIPVILLTGAEPEEVRAAMPRGAGIYMQKPIDLQKLERILLRMCGK